MNENTMVLPFSKNVEKQKDWEVVLESVEAVSQHWSGVSEGFRRTCSPMPFRVRKENRCFIEKLMMTTEELAILSAQLKVTVERLARIDDVLAMEDDAVLRERLREVLDHNGFLKAYGDPFLRGEYRRSGFRDYEEQDVDSLREYCERTFVDCKPAKLAEDCVSSK